MALWGLSVTSPEWDIARRCAAIIRMYNYFCQPAERAVFGPRVRWRSVEHMLAELRLLRERYAFRSLAASLKTTSSPSNLI